MAMTLIKLPFLLSYKSICPPKKLSLSLSFLSSWTILESKHVLTLWMSVTVGKVLTSAEIKIINFHLGSVRKFLNVSRPKQDGKKPVPNAGTDSEPGRGCSPMHGTGNFPDFFEKNPVLGKWHLGTQTSNEGCKPVLLSNSSQKIRHQKKLT